MLSHSFSFYILLEIYLQRISFFFLPQEKLSKIEETPAGAPAAATTATSNAAGAASSTSSTGTNRTRRTAETEEGGVNQDHLVQLIDMGFSRALATEALLHTSSLEQATEYLLSYPPPLGRNSTSGTSLSIVSTDQFNLLF